MAEVRVGLRSWPVRRYFLQQWPQLCFLACDGSVPCGVVVAKTEPHRSSGALRGYIGMLVVTKPYRGRGLGALIAYKSAAVLMYILYKCQRKNLQQVTSLQDAHH